MLILKKILGVIDFFNRAVARITSWIVIVLVGVTVYEVILRYAFNAPTQWVFEFSYLTHGVYFLLLGAYTLAVRGHVNVDIIHRRLKPRFRALCDILTYPVFFFFIAVMFWYGGKWALLSIQARETLSSAWAPPIYPVKAVIPFAALMVLLQGTAKLVRDLHTAITGREGEL